MNLFLPSPDACALIGWMLTVRVEDRATVEDVANHWWVNCGFDMSVCDCPSAMSIHVQPSKRPQVEDDSASPSANGQTRSKRLLSDPHMRLSFPPKQPTEEPLYSSLPHGYQMDEPRSSQSPSTSLRPTATCPAPKKGILKKTYERASATSEKLDAPPDVSALHGASTAMYQMEGGDGAMADRRRKGILKRNGKIASKSKATGSTPRYPSTLPPSRPDCLRCHDPELIKRHQMDMEVTQEDELLER